VRGDAADAFPQEFDALIGRLNERVYARLEEERGPRRRANIFAFPQQMAALRDPLTQFVSDIFSSTSFNQQILLRGVYLTSGTQDGTQIDRLLGSIGRRFGVAADAVAPAAGRGKAFFMERLLKQVVIGESGLAGVNRRLEMRTMVWQLGAYAAILLFLIGSLVLLSVSYANNRDYLAQVAADPDHVAQRHACCRELVEVLLPQLNAVRAISDSAKSHVIRHRGACGGDSTRATR
jgi:type VI secretion system protein ImpL